MKNNCKPSTLLFISFVLIIMSSCARCVTDINSYGNYNLYGKTYYLESGKKDVSSNDLEFKEYAKYVHENLKNQGAIKTTNKKTADMRITMSYGIEDKSHIVTVQKEIKDKNQNTIGYQSVPTTKAEYLRVISVCAYDNLSEETEPTMLWKTDFKSSGRKNNLQDVMPNIIYAGNGKFGKSSNGWHSYTVYGYNEAFKIWKQNAMSNAF